MFNKLVSVLVEEFFCAGKSPGETVQTSINSQADQQKKRKQMKCRLNTMTWLLY